MMNHDVRKTVRILLAVTLGLTPWVAGERKEPGRSWWNDPDESRSAAALQEIFGPGAETAWEIPARSPQSQYRFERDASLGRTALCHDGPHPMILKGRTAYDAGVETRCLLRLAATEKQPNAGFTLQVAKDPNDPRDQGVRITVSGRYDTYALSVAVAAPYTAANHTFNLKPYPIISPVLAGNIRMPLEKAMAEAPSVQDKVVLLRFQNGPDWARAWVDGRLVLDVTEVGTRSLRDQERQKELARIQAMPDEAARAAKLKAFQEEKLKDRALPTAGNLLATLAPGTHLAELTVRSLVKPPPLYEVIALDGYVLDRDLLDSPGTAVAQDALPFGRTVTVQGVPFHFVDRAATGGADHLDIGRSILRQANMEGYHQAHSHRFGGTFLADPARIQLRVPNGRYDALYAIATFDEGKDSIPLVSASFYRPGAGYARVFEATVPSYRARKADATPLPVSLENGRSATLWLVRVPLSPEALASFTDMEILELELTKKVRQYRSYPDPYIYGWHQGGLPSGVHVYALTLHHAEVHVSLQPAVFGHVWAAQQKPAYEIELLNRTSETRPVKLTARTTSYDGEEKTEQAKDISLPPGRPVKEKLTFTVRRFGVHRLEVSLANGNQVWTEERNFTLLAPDTRAVRWEPGKGPVFGFWSYGGGHYTPPGREHFRLMAMAGARGFVHKGVVDEDVQKNIFDKHNFQFGPNAWPVSPQWAWAGEDPIDPQKAEAFARDAVDKFRKAQGDNPPIVTFFPEPHLSQRLTAGNIPSYWGEKDYEYTDQEKYAIRVFFNTSRIAAEAIRKEWPQTKILIPWGDPLFVWPLLRAGFPKNLIDGSGLDMIGFERLPEQQLHQQSTHRLYLLKEEYRKYGMENPFLPYVEGVFVPTEPGACTWEEQAVRYHRWSLISLAYGITHFFSGWFAFDAGNYYGAEHYGGCGIQRRIPYADPKPAYAHFATMTRMLDRAQFDRWLPTGSLTTYCLKFRRESGGPVYALWTVRGRRPVTLAIEKDAPATVTDSMDNTTPAPSKDGKTTVLTGPSPVYVQAAGEALTAQAGEPDHSDAIPWSRSRNQETWFSGPVTHGEPIQKAIQIASLGDGSWQIQPEERDELYETNNYDTLRYHGRMTARTAGDAGRPGQHLAVHLEAQPVERKLMPWYTIIRPKKPVVIPGKARQLGLWVKASSDWGRVVYCLRDQKNERWVSIGTKDEWNCNDVHGWSYFNFDGWRRVHFELPSHTAYDTFREYGTTWWRSGGGDDVVDLPLRIEKIIVERRTHVLYVNDVQPADPADVLLSDLWAEYETEFDATEKAVAQSRIRMKLPEAPKSLPNPIAEMAQKNPLPATTLQKVTDPDWGYDGTRCHVHFAEVADAGQYQVWVAAHPDGRGAVAMGRLAKSGQLLEGLRPATPLYLWLIYTDKGQGKDQKQSKPSNVLAIQLVDAFGQK